MKNALILLLLCFFSIKIIAQELFPDLKYTNIDSYITLGYIPDFELDSTLCNELDKTDHYYCEDPDELFKKVGTYKLSKSTTLALYYTEGPSGDPAIYIVKNNKEEVLSVQGTGFHFKGKTIYVDGCSNTLFDVKRKFIYENGIYREVKQPFYYVNITGTLNRDITIFQTKNLSKPVAFLPKGYSIDVVLSEFGKEDDRTDYFLIKTKFGLLGWIKLEMGDWYGGLLDNLYFCGD